MLQSAPWVAELDIPQWWNLMPAPRRHPPRSGGNARYSLASSHAWWCGIPPASRLSISSLIRSWAACRLSPGGWISPAPRTSSGGASLDDDVLAFDETQRFQAVRERRGWRSRGQGRQLPLALLGAPGRAGEIKLETIPRTRTRQCRSCPRSGLRGANSHGSWSDARRR
jgi:hypothetical protein